LNAEACLEVVLRYEPMGVAVTMSSVQCSSCERGCVKGGLKCATGADAG